MLKLIALAGLLTYTFFFWPSHLLNSWQWLMFEKEMNELLHSVLTAAGTVQDFHPIPF
jgi:hypothetical protein